MSSDSDATLMRSGARGQEVLHARRASAGVPASSPSTVVAMDWWQLTVSIVGGLLLVWLALIGALVWISRGQSQKFTLVEALRLGPDVVRLTRRLVADSGVPRGVRIWLGVLLVYLLSPIDLVPDFIPVIGYLDDAIVVALVLRFVTRHAGAAAIDRHWPGTEQGLSSLRAILGLRTT